MSMAKQKGRRRRLFTNRGGGTRGRPPPPLPWGMPETRRTAPRTERCPYPGRIPFIPSVDRVRGKKKTRKGEGKGRFLHDTVRAVHFGEKHLEAFTFDRASRSRPRTRESDAGPRRSSSSGRDAFPKNRHKERCEEPSRFLLRMPVRPRRSHSACATSETLSCGMERSHHVTRKSAIPTKTPCSVVPIRVVRLDIPRRIHSEYRKRSSFTS